jgi:hypothetical protein
MGAAPAAGAPMAGAAPMMGAAPAMGAAAPARPSTPAGPKDGDPSKPMVSIPGINCGAPRVNFGAQPQTVKIGGRDVFVAYPCKHEGAPVTFFFFIHGTVQEEQKLPFTLGTYSVHELVDSHNLIVVAPKAVGTQWGNGDNGVDLPHLYEVIDWTYNTFQEKFDIRSMWAHGGSWGAFYLSTFACDPMLEKRLNGVYMVVGGGCPRCSDRLSCVVIQAELEKGMNMMIPPAQQEMLVDQAMVAPYATKHGCDGKMGPTMLGNTRIWNFPNCDKGWYHSYILGPGQHADKLDQNTVIELTNQMKMTEQ